MGANIRKVTKATKVASGSKKATKKIKAKKPGIWSRWLNGSK